MEPVEPEETYVSLAVCDLCGNQPQYCLQAQDRLEAHTVEINGRPVCILTLPGEEVIPMCCVLMRRDPPYCSLTVLPEEQVERKTSP